MCPDKIWRNLGPCNLPIGEYLLNEVRLLMKMGMIRRTFFTITKKLRMVALSHIINNQKSMIHILQIDFDKLSPTFGY